jgi:hypothetical protein
VQGQDHRLGAVVRTDDGRFDQDQYQLLLNQFETLKGGLIEISTNCS